MAAGDLRQSKDISHSLRRNDVSNPVLPQDVLNFLCNYVARRSVFSVFMQLLEDIVADLEGECNRLRGEIAQWQKLQKETLVCLELGNACFEDAVAKRHELLLDCERLREENLTLNGKLNQAMDDAMLAESELVDAYMKRSEMRNTLLDLKDKLTRFRNSNDDLRKKINDLRAQKRLVEVVDQLVNLT